jgi:hypothetical protein
MTLAERLNRQLHKHFPANVIVGRELSYSEISKRLNAALRTVQAKVRVAKSTIISDNEKVRPVIDVIGSAEDQKIIITILVSPDRDHFHFTQIRYRNFLLMLSMATHHELVHRKQFSIYKKAIHRLIPVRHSSRIGKERKADIDYYREWIEIDAYAHDIAMEIKYFYPSIDSLRVVRHIESYPKLAHFKRYATTFRGTEWGEVRKMLIRHIIKWLPKCAIAP